MKEYALYRQRTFSQKFNTAFDWLRDNWRPVLKWSTWLLLPFSLVQGFGLTNLLDMSLMGMDPDITLTSSTWWSVGLSYLCMFVGGYLSLSLFFALMRLSFVEGRKLGDVRFREVWHTMVGNMLRLLIGIFTTGVVGIPVVVVAVMMFIFGPLGFLPFCAILLCYLAIVVCFFPAYLLNDDNDLVTAVKQSFRYGWKCWWGIVSVSIVMGILASALQGLAAVPFYAIFLGQALFVGRSSADTPLLLSFVYFVVGVLMSYVTYLITVLGVLSSTILYGHAADKIDGISAESEVDEFDAAGDSQGKDEIDDFDRP